VLKDKQKTEEKQAKAKEMESHLVKYLKPVLSELAVGEDPAGTGDGDS
jgi:hypothetical protein